MTHHLRKKLQSDLKHSLFYIGRILMQTASNFWETSKGQQLITLALLAIISVFINIYFGLITIDKASINIQSVISISGVLLLLFLLVNFVRAPFQLDREQEEEKANLKLEIGALNQKLTERLNPTKLDKLQYKIDRLKELISQREKLFVNGYAPVSEVQRFNVGYIPRVEKFLAEYFDASYVQRFQENRKDALDEFLKELLD